MAIDKMNGTINCVLDIKKGMWLVNHECDGPCQDLHNDHCTRHLDRLGIVEGDSLDHPQGPLWILDINVHALSQREVTAIGKLVVNAPDTFIALDALLDAVVEGRLLPETDARLLAAREVIDAVNSWRLTGGCQ